MRKASVCIPFRRKKRLRLRKFVDIEVGKVISTLKVIIDRVYVIGDGEEHKVNVFLKGEDFEYAEPM